MLGIIEQRKGIALGVNRALLKSGIRLAPGNGRGVHAQLGGHGNFHRGVSGAHLEIHEIAHGMHRLSGRDEMAIAELAVHDGLEADAFRNLVQSVTKRPFIQRRIQLLLVLGAGDIGQIKHHIGGGKRSQVRRGRAGHVKRTRLRRFRGHAVASQLGIGEYLYPDFSAAFLFHKLLELLIAHSHIIAGRHGMPKAQGKRPFRKGGACEGNAAQGGKGGKEGNAVFHDPVSCCERTGHTGSARAREAGAPRESLSLSPSAEAFRLRRRNICAFLHK